MTAVGQDVHVGRVLNQRYRLISPVGSGASARVYLAEDIALRRRVAVKLLHNGLTTDATFRKRFRAEAHASAQLSHPNIMAVYDWSDAGERTAETSNDGAATGEDAPAYLVTELLTGGSLRSMLDAGHRLSLSQALIVGLHAAEGLSYAHYNGFVHRDIKPANLLFGSEGRLRLADFGIARAVAEAAWTEPEGALVGTARYAAPEQASGSGVDGRADVYALAVTMVEAVTGSAPLTGPTPLATMVLRQETDLVVPDELGPLADALRAAGRARVEERCTAEELAWTLRAAASELPRPQKLPLTGLVADQRAQPPSSEHSPETAETGVLVLEGEGVTDAHPSIDLSTHIAPSDGPEFAPDDEVDADGIDPPDELDDELDDRRRWPIVVLLLLLVVGAVVAYRGRDSAESTTGSGQDSGISDVTHPVGTFVGRPVDDVVAEIERNGWTHVITEIRRDGAEVGEVLEQAPASGTEWAEGLEVTLVVSVGGALQTVPELVGLQLEVALDELSQVGLFLGGTGEAFDETAPLWQVLSASLEPGSEAETGTAVDLVWSKGPAPRTIPDLSGSTLAEAQSALDELALTHVVTEEYSQTVPEGEIIVTTPSVGASVARGSEVTLVVSLGLPFIEVPDVAGMSAAEAADVLIAAGFVVTDTVGPPNGEVLATDPPAGEVHRQGTAVIIFVRSS